MKRGIAYFCGGAFLLAATSATLAQKAQVIEKRLSAKSADGPKAGAFTLDPQIAIQMANDYFNAAQFMTADFVQIGADGRRSEGKLYISKPGRMRFEYAQPATIEIIADGVSVAIRDRKLQTQEIYFISETPLKFLLKANVDLKKDVKVIDVSSDEKSTTIAVEDSATFGGVSRIKLNFDNKNFNFKQWEVTDPQGYQTLVTLHNVDLKATPDGSLFRIPSNNIFPFQN